MPGPSARRAETELIMSAKYSFLKGPELRPSGWVRRQLEIQAAGQAGQLDRIWPDVRDSRWVGGDREGWERVPYWLDGFIPLAYLLGDEDMISRAKRYVDAILAGQQSDGWICPNGDTPREKYDMWAVELLSKVLFVYYDLSGDGRVPEAVSRALRNWYEGLRSGSLKLFEWSRSRWFEALVAIRRLKELRGEEPWLLDLARMLREQGLDWGAASKKWDRFYYEWTHDTHIVNVGMCMKASELCADVLGEPPTGEADRLYAILERFHGTPSGAFNGDECLAGRSPIRGFELCSVAELMYSYEWLFALTGRQKWAERLERLAFNALPATLSDDMWTHQYDQMTNQNACVPGHTRSLFGTNGTEANMFGLEPNYGCCTANHGQAWPHFAMSTVMRSRGGLRVVTPVPALASIDFRGTRVELEIGGDYPFDNDITFTVTAGGDTDFALEIPVPGFATRVTVDGRPFDGRLIRRKGFPKGKTVITLGFRTEGRLTRTTGGLYALSAGSLLYALPVRAEKKKYEYVRYGTERKFPYCDYRLYPASDWNFGFDGPRQSFEPVRRARPDVPFSSEDPPLSISVRVAHIDWGLEPGYRYNCAAYPAHTAALDGGQTAEFVPYGCAKLRMTELPLCRRPSKSGAAGADAGTEPPGKEK